MASPGCLTAQEVFCDLPPPQAAPAEAVGLAEAASAAVEAAEAEVVVLDKEGI
jgi:hypothetical protein